MMKTEMLSLPGSSNKPDMKRKEKALIFLLYRLRREVQINSLSQTKQELRL